MTPKMTTRPPDILVVDDTPENLRLLVGILKRQGYTARPARNGRIGLNSARSHPPDLILLDIMMSDMDGFEVCQQLKSDDTTRDIPIIFITALQELQNKMKGFAAGGVDYIAKPFEEEEVLARVNTHLTIQRLQHDLQDENARFRALEEASFEGVIIHENGIIFDVNHTLTDMFGYNRDDMLGQPVTRFVTPVSQELAREQLSHSDNQPHKIQGIKRDGSLFPAMIQGKSIVYQGRHVRVAAVQDLSRQRQLEGENRTFKIVMQGCDRLGPLIGKSEVMRNVYDLIINAAATDYGVIISGESGTGKELAAQTIHNLSHRKDQKFVPINCGAVPEALFEREFFGHRKGAFTGATMDSQGFLDTAHKGTLFLDEVTELTLEQQVKLLRVLQSQEYIPIGGSCPKTADIRIIAATNKNIKVLREQGLIRDDFFYRIHVISIDLPPLRERKEDLSLLIKHFLNSYESYKHGFDLPPYMMEALFHYDWPGNIRELENELQRYLTTGGFDFLAPASTSVLDKQQELNLALAVKKVEKQYILQALQQTCGHRKKTADLLGISRRTLYHKMKEYGLDDTE